MMQQKAKHTTTVRGFAGQRFVGAEVGRRKEKTNENVWRRGAARKNGRGFGSFVNTNVID